MIPKRPTTGQKAALTRKLNEQSATKKDVELLEKRILNLEKQLHIVEKSIVRSIKRAIRAAR